MHPSKSLFGCSINDKPFVFQEIYPSFPRIIIYEIYEIQDIPNRTMKFMKYKLFPIECVYIYPHKSEYTISSGALALYDLPT